MDAKTETTISWVSWPYDGQPLSGSLYRAVWGMAFVQRETQVNHTPEALNSTIFTLTYSIIVVLTLPRNLSGTHWMFMLAWETVRGAFLQVSQLFLNQVRFWVSHHRASPGCPSWFKDVLSNRKLSCHSWSSALQVVQNSSKRAFPQLSCNQQWPRENQHLGGFAGSFPVHRSFDPSSVPLLDRATNLSRVRTVFSAPCSNYSIGAPAFKGFETSH